MSEYYLAVPVVFRNINVKTASDKPGKAAKSPKSGKKGSGKKSKDSDQKRKGKDVDEDTAPRKARKSKKD